MHHLLEQGVAFESSRGYSVVATLLVAKLKSIKVSSPGADAADLTDWWTEEEILIHPCFTSGPIVLINIWTTSWYFTTPQFDQTLQVQKLSLSHMRQNSETVMKGPFWAQFRAFLMYVPVWRKSILHLLLMSNHFTILCFSNVFPQLLQYCAFTVASSITLT